MKLDEFLKNIIHSKIEDWTVISCWGGNSGPSFLNQFIVWNSGSGEFQNLEIESHSMVASYRNNLSIMIAWGLKHNDNFIEEWANNFSVQRAASDFVDFFYNGALVLREIIVSVDGGRCYLPLPKLEFDNKGKKVTRLYVSKYKSRFVEMLNKFSSTYNYNYRNYLSQSGIEVVDERWS